MGQCSAPHLILLDQISDVNDAFMGVSTIS